MGRQRTGRGPAWIGYWRLILAGTSLAFVGLAVLVMQVVLPARHSPLAPLDLRDPVGLATRGKIAALAGKRSQCLSLLADAGIKASPVSERKGPGGCGYRDGVRLESAPLAHRPAVEMVCPMAAALILWERETVMPAAERHFGQKVRLIRHAGTYACRTIRGSRRNSRRLSEHARANAIDIAGFQLEDGSTISVLKGWSGSRAERRFLRDVRKGACRVFRTVLGPDYNAAHRDHFHFDLGRYRLCR